MSTTAKARTAAKRLRAAGIELAERSRGGTTGASRVTRRTGGGELPSPSIEFRRADWKKFFRELECNERLAAQRTRRWQVRDPAYRALWKDPRWKALIAEGDRMLAKHRARRPKHRS